VWWRKLSLYIFHLTKNSFDFSNSNVTFGVWTREDVNGKEWLLGNIKKDALAALEKKN
jgi:hypothetical protein